MDIAAGVQLAVLAGLLLLGFVTLLQGEGGYSRGSDGKHVLGVACTVALLCLHGTLLALLLFLGHPALELASIGLAALLSTLLLVGSAARLPGHSAARTTGVGALVTPPSPCCAGPTEPCTQAAVPAAMAASELVCRHGCIPYRVVHRGRAGAG